MPGRREQSIGERQLPILVQQAGGQPEGLVAMEEEPHLARVARPPEIALGRARPLIGNHRVGYVRS